MQGQIVDLSRYNNATYRSEVPTILAALWFVLGQPILSCSVLPSSKLRVWLLRLFGAQIGEGVVIKPRTRVKYPWLLQVADHAWLGEDCWIDNLCQVRIGASACVSQGAYLCTGNHDWSMSDFTLRRESICIGNMAWVGAKAVICPGVTLEEGAIATAGSVINKTLPAWTIWSGNPATFVRERVIKNSTRAVTQ